MDFVTYKIGKKLKEKGFNQPCLAHYTNGKFEYNIEYCDAAILQDLYQNWGNNVGCFVDAPTISQVLKWLREEKKIYLEIVIVVDAEYMCDIYKINPRPIECLGSTEYFKTYEQAALAGVEYCLDNLI